MTNLLERIYDFANSEVTADVNNSSTDSDDVTINNSVTDPNGNTQTGGALHLLRQAGYSEGDALSSWNWSNGSSGSVSSSSFTNILVNEFVPRWQWDDHFPTNVTVKVVLTGRVNPNGDQIDLRVQNASDSETVVELTGETGSGFRQFRAVNTDYTPTTTGSVINYLLQAKNSDNTTSVTADDLDVAFIPTL